MSSNTAWVTLATNDSYSLGALVLAHSLKTAKTVHKLAILITPGVTTSMKQQIEAVFDDVKVVDVLDSKDQTHLALMCRPELGVTFTKLHCWTLTNYEKCVFLDADTLVLQNCDELFEREELSAAPDPGWPDCFNSGVFVFKPSQETFGRLLEFARTRGSFDGGDQGLLNMYFKEWAHTDISKHLSFTYNVVWSSTYSYLPALKQFGQNMKIIHFIAASKPWLQSFNTETRIVTPTSGGTGLQTLLQFWWDLFCQYVHPSLSTEMIESRLSSRYSYDFHPEIQPDYNTSNNYTPNSNTLNNFNTPIYEPPKRDHYNFIDPWEEYFDANVQKNYEVKENTTDVNQVENIRGDGNLVEVCLNNYCEEEVKNNYSTFRCEEEQTRDYSFQNNVVEECSRFGNEEKNDAVHFEKVIESNEPKQELHTRENEFYPACYDEIPNNPYSSLSVNNCRPDSPTHCEVPKDQTCDLDGGLAGQFARVSLGEKTADQKALEDFLRRQSWEQGNMDYLGKDSFSNIWAKINETLGKVPEVIAEPSIIRAPSPPEVVHSEEPKPLKSALKKSSTTIPPVESELQTDNNEPPVKQLEKLDLSKDILKGLKIPDTPTVTSPSPPTTPATQAEEPSKSESVKETPKYDECTKEITKSTEQELPKPELTEPAKVILESEISTALKETSEPKSESPVIKPDEPKKEVSPPTETPLPVGNTLPAVSNDPPVAPKRTNKGAKTPEKK